MDTRLPFGARQSPCIFHRLTQAVRRMLEKRNIQLVVFLDDFLIVAKDFNECIHGYNMLISLLRELGFSISWKKVCDPTTKLTFLGVCIDTVAGTLSLEQTQVDDICDQIKLFCACRRASRRQLESLAGKLVWASHVIPWSRLHLRTLFDLISTLKRASHKCKLDSVRNDLQWWLKGLVIGNNTHLIWDTRPVTHVYTDSSNRCWWEPSAKVTGYIPTGQLIFRLSLFIISTLRSWQLSMLPHIGGHHCGQIDG